MTHKRLTLFAGHYGSGKTNIALNYARWLRRKGEAVTVADLDIVNPYFRTKDSEEDLKKEGIGLIVSPFANSNLDVPAMPKETYALIAERGECGVLDIGGDDRGALALGRYVPEIRAEGDYEMLFVINRARPLTRTVADTILVLREIEAACGLPFTAVVNNTNLGQATAAADVLSSMPYAEAVAARAGLPLKMTCCAARLCDALRGSIPNLFPMEIQKLYYQLREMEEQDGKTDISGRTLQGLRPVCERLSDGAAGAVEDAAESKGTCARGADGAGQVRRLCVLRDDVSRLCHYGRKVRRAGRCRKKY